MIRGGLTGKFKDIETLLRSLDYGNVHDEHLSISFEPSIGQVADSLCFRPVKDFGVTRLRVPGGASSSLTWKCETTTIAVVTSGSGSVGGLDVAQGDALICKPGEVFEIRARTDGFYELFVADSL